MKYLFLCLLAWMFIMNIGTVHAAGECTLEPNPPNCTTCISNHQTCDGRDEDYILCRADRSCNIPEIPSCDCNEAVGCQVGSTCSGEQPANPACHYCVTPDRACNSDPQKFGSAACYATGNACGPNTGLEEGWLYTKFNGQEGCQLRGAPAQPCTTGCGNGYTCINSTCQIPGSTAPPPQCSPETVKGQYCAPANDANCPNKLVNTIWNADCSERYECTTTSCNATPTPGVTAPPPNPCDYGTPSFSCAQYSVQDLSTGTTVTGKAKNSVVSGNYGTSVLTINPGDKIKVDGSFNLNAEGLWKWNWFNITNTSGTLLSRCVEAGTLTGSVAYNYCLGGIGQIISDQKDGNGNYKRPTGGWDMMNEGALVTNHNTYDQYFWSPYHSDYREYKGTCNASGRISCCDRGDNPDQSVDANGNRTKECRNPNESGDTCEFAIEPDTCKYDDGDGTPKIPYVLSRDKQYTRSFSTPGDYIVEGAQNYQCGDNENNPCQVKVTVRNPGPPTGSITANPSPCVMTEGNTTCTTTISRTVQNGTEMKVVIDGVEFVPPTAITYNHTSSSDAPWITAATSTFQLWAKNTYYPDYALISTANVNGYPYISGNVYLDPNENATGTTGIAGVTITLSTGATTTTDANGHYLFSNVAPGAYDVTMSVPGTYQRVTGSNPIQNISLSAPRINQDFFLSPLHTVSGRVFNDLDKNRVFNTGDVMYTAGLSMSINGNGISNSFSSNSSGTYTFGSLPSGTYTVSVGGAPSGYAMIWPRSGPPPAFTITLGNGPCTPGSLGLTIGAACNGAYNIDELNFAISNAIPWIQIIGLDARFDNGFSNPVPSSASSTCSTGYTMIPGSTTTPGVISIGGSTPSLSFGTRLTPSVEGWVIGSPFPEYFSPLSSTPNADNTFQASGIRTAYDYVMANAKQSNIAPSTDNMQNISGCSNYSSCSLSNASNGLFQAESDLTLTNTVFTGNKDFVFFINGNLTINGTIETPVGSTATFIVKGNITVTPTVGTSSVACPPQAGQIQGFFSTDKSFTIESKDTTQQGLNCSDGTGGDLSLHVDGVIITNASLTSGGFTNKRDLCGTNVTNPSMSIKERLDFVLNAPEILKQKNYIYREIAP